MSESLVYKNLIIYRSLMNILYLGRYNQRFQTVASFIPKDAKSVFELCFGDVKIANYCTENGLKWTGYDLNASFVENAVKQGFFAVKCDILNSEEFQKSDVGIIQGSLYHFHENLEDVFAKIFRATDFVIVSEPVRNMTQWPWPFSNLATYMTKVSKSRSESFRFDQDSLIQALTPIAAKLNFHMQIVSHNRDMILVLKKTKHA